MLTRICLVLPLAGACLLAYHLAGPADACCPAGPRGKPVVNADQTVIIIWDAASKTQHFIRRATFKTDLEDIGFIVPSPAQPELGEAGNEAFPYLLKLTAPEIVKRTGGGGMSCACGAKSAQSKSAEVKVLEEKVVAGFKAAVLETTSAAALVKWLEENGYAFSPEIEAWSKPYVEKNWKFTALKVAKDRNATAEKEDSTSKGMTAPALRLTFKTEQPLFPYREPDSRSAADSLGAKHRLLRIYFLAEAIYQGELTKEVPWTGKVAWAGKLKDEDRKKILEHLKLPETTGPAEWWLTEFEDDWPYKVAPADVVFSRSPDQTPRKRHPIAVSAAAPYPTDVTVYAIAAVVIGPALINRLRRRRK